MFRFLLLFLFINYYFYLLASAAFFLSRSLLLGCVGATSAVGDCVGDLLITRGVP
jgi:hypothetical protein